MHCLATCLPHHYLSHLKATNVDFVAISVSVPQTRARDRVTSLRPRYTYGKAENPNTSYSRICSQSFPVLLSVHK